MRTFEEYHKILELWEQQYPQSSIAHLTGIPRTTVRDCIKRYGNLEGLKKDIHHASRNTPDYLLQTLASPTNVKIQKTYAYLLGLYLGDGYISKSHKIFKLRIVLDAKYPAIIQTCVTAIQTLLPDNSVNVINRLVGENEEKRLSCVEVFCYYKHWPELFPQSGHGPKHQRSIVLEDWQQAIVDRYPLECFRGLYHSDGSRFSNVVNGKDYPRYAFANNSAEIIRIFCDTCDKLNIHWTQKVRRDTACIDIFISRRADVTYLDQQVGTKTQTQPIAI